MTAQCCTSECLNAAMAQNEFSSCRVSSREDEDPPKAAELFGEAGLAIAIPLVIAFLVTLGSGITLASP